MQKEVLEASFLGKPGSELNMVFQPLTNVLCTVQ